MFPRDLFPVLQISYGSGSFENPVINSGTELQRTIQLFHDFLPILSQRAMFFHLCRPDVPIETAIRSCKTLRLPFSCMPDLPLHIFTAFFRFRFLQMQNIHGMQFHTQINPV